MLIHLELKPSRRLAGVLAAAHAATGALLPWIDVRWELKLALAIAVLASFVVSVRRHALLTARDAIVALEWSEDGTVNVQSRDGAWHAARLLATTFVAPGLTVLNLGAVEGKRIRHVVLMSDSADAEAYRRLRVRLRWDRARLA